MVVVLPLCREVLPLLLKSVLSLVILHSHIPWAAVPLPVILKLVLLRRRVVESSILSEILVEISLYLVVPVVVPVGSVILAVLGWSIVVCKWSSKRGRSVISSVLVSVVIWRSVSSIVLVRIISLRLREGQRWVRFLY